MPTVLEGLAIGEFPEFVATQYFPKNRLEPILTDWRLPEGGLYFVTPTTRARPSKVAALGEFLITKLADASWSAEAMLARKRPTQRSGQSRRR
jgi:DNA-binding transcriptional LysR family regulator